VIAKKQRVMLATAGDEGLVDGLLAREAGQWLFEVKQDGYRVVAAGEDGQVRLWTRNGIDCTSAYPEVVRALNDQPYQDFEIDGEVVVRDASGQARFELLQQRGGIAAARAGVEEELAATYVAFDILSLDGVDLTPITLDRRRGLLGDAFEFGGALELSELLEGDAAELLAKECAAGGEGLIAKRTSSGYRAGRSRNWYKLKCLRRDDMVIAGYTEPKGSRVGFGALVLGMNEGRRLVYTGRVGTGFDDATLKSLAKRLAKLRTDVCPFASVPPGLGAVNWVTPELVCEVGFGEWSSSGKVRHPRYLGLRPDKEATEVRRERQLPEVKLSNLDKIYYPAIEGTKGEVVSYYDLVAPLMLAEIADRPLVLERFPNGVKAKGFYQKNTPDHVPDYISRVRVDSNSGDSISYSVVHDEAGLRYLANQAALVMHVLLSDAADPAHPIEIIWDLDPTGDDFARVQQAALLLKDRLDDLGLAPRVKSTGSKGLHIHIDISDQPGVVGYDMSRAFASRLAWELVEEAPNDFSLEFSKKERQGKLLIDVLRNGHASHAAAAYSLRAVPEAGAAAPISWEEALDPEFRPRQLTMRNMAERLSAGIDPWADRAAPTSTITGAAEKLLG